MFFEKNNRLAKLNDDFNKAHYEYEMSSKATDQRFKGFDKESRNMSDEFLQTHRRIQDKINKFT